MRYAMLLLVSLCACADFPELEGTISDAMLPLDQVRSQAPQADPEPVAGESDATTSGTGPAPAQASEPPVEPVPDAEVAAPASDEGEGAE